MHSLHTPRDDVSRVDRKKGTGGITAGNPHQMGYAGRVTAGCSMNRRSRVESPPTAWPRFSWNGRVSCPRGGEHRQLSWLA